MSNTTKNTTAELESLRLPELQVRFIEVVGEISKSPNRKFLIRRITETLAAQAQKVEVKPVSAHAPAAVGTPEPKPAKRTRSKVKAQEPAPVEAPKPAPTPVTGPAQAEPPPAASTAAPGPVVVPAAPAQPSEQQPALAAVDAPTPPAKPARGRFSGLTVDDLQAKYREVVGRSTGSDNKAYLIWKIREAEKGRITVGPVQTRMAEGTSDADVKILPLRLETKVVETMDTAWRERGLKTRMEFFRRALGHYLTHLGATEAAALFTQPE